MTDIPERIWAEGCALIGAVQIGDWADTIRYMPDGAEYIRADVAAAQLAERDARIAELEGHCIGYKHVAETEADRSLELEKRIAELEAAQRWVSVGERLPEVGQWVLVRIDAETLVFEFMGRGWRNEDEYIFAVSDVTHWMPLPPPPVTPETP